MEENWKVLASLFPAGWQQMAWQSGAVERLCGFPSPDVLLGMLMLHVGAGLVVAETVVRAKVANWTDISDVLRITRSDVKHLALNPSGTRARTYPGQTFGARLPNPG